MEKVLAPTERKGRLKTTFNKGNFEALLMDLTLQGVMDLQKTLYVDSAWKSFRFKEKYDAFLERYLA